jgi:streptogramin lyase
MGKIGIKKGWRGNRRAWFIGGVIGLVIASLAYAAGETGRLPGRAGEMPPLQILGHVVLHPQAPGHSIPGNGMGIDREGHLYVLDAEGQDPFNRKNQVLKLDPQGQVLDRIALTIPAFTIHWMTADPDGHLWITYQPTDSQGPKDTSRVTKLDPQGKVLWQMPGEGAQLDCVATDAEGNGYVGSSNGQAIYKISPAGKFLVAWDLRPIVAELGGGGNAPANHIAVAPDGSVYVNMQLQRLIKLDANGKLVKALRTWSSPPHLNAMAAGPGGKLYVTTWADPALYRISDEDPVVSYLRLENLYGHEVMQLNQSGLACDAAGNVYFVGYERFVKTPTQDLILWQLSP